MGRRSRRSTTSRTVYSSSPNCLRTSIQSSYLWYVCFFLSRPARIPKTEVTTADLIWFQILFFTLFSRLKIQSISAFECRRTNRDTAKNASSLHGFLPLASLYYKTSNQKSAELPTFCQQGIQVNTLFYCTSTSFEPYESSSGRHYY